LPLGYSIIAQKNFHSLNVRGQEQQYAESTHRTSPHHSLIVPAVRLLNIVHDALRKPHKARVTQSLATGLLDAYMTSFPKGISEKAANFMCCFANGMPIIVIAHRIAKMRWVNAIQMPPIRIQIKFITVERHPVDFSE